MNKSRLVVFVFCIVTCVAHLLGQKVGNATFYSKRAHGTRMASGVRYHKDSMFCAHKTYPFGTLLKVRNLKNDRIVIVKVTDRGPHSRNRIIDLSYAAAKELDMIRFGSVPVEITEYEDIVVPYRPASVVPNLELEMAEEEEFIPGTARRNLPPK